MFPNDKFSSPTLRPNPFIENVFQAGSSEMPGVVEIHNQAMTQCIDVLDSLVRIGENGATRGQSGRTILMASPRAGYGKSHLVARLKKITERLVAVVALPMEPSQEIGWQSVWESIWHQYEASPCQKLENCSLLDELGRYFAATLTSRAFSEGGIETKDLPVPIESVENDFHRLFDPKSSSSDRMPLWFGKRAPDLVSSVGAALGKQWDMTQRDISWWSEIFLLHSLEKKSAVENKIFQLRDAEVKIRLGQFFRIAGALRPTAFIADHLDGFFGSDTAGMQMAEILTGLRVLVPRSLTIICLNEDVWDSVFSDRIPSAWIDRLAGEPASLKGISTESAEALVRGRLLAMGTDTLSANKFVEQFRNFVSERSDPEDGELFPREVLRTARTLWDNLDDKPADSSVFSEAAAPMFEQPSKPEVTVPIDPIATVPITPIATVPIEPPNATTPVKPVSDLKEESGPIGNLFSAAAPPQNTAILKEQEVSLADAARALADSVKEKIEELKSEKTLPFPPPQLPPVPPEATVPVNPVKPVDPDTVPLAAPTPRSYFGADDPQIAAQAAAANAAGKGLTDIDAIVAEIRGGGSRALSEIPASTQKTNGSNGSNGHHGPSTDESPNDAGVGSGITTSQTPQPPAAVGEQSGNPFWANNLEKRLQDLERVELVSDALRWQPGRVASLVRQIGEHYPAVGQQVLPLEGGNGAGYLKWTVKGYQILLGFESPQRPSYWDRLLRTAATERSVTKVAVLSHRSDPFDFHVISSIEADHSIAIRYFDIIELTDDDLTMLYAAERFLRETEGVKCEKSPLEVVARRLDPFWHRLTKMLPTATA